MNKLSRKPKVSVTVITYNQSKYIGICLESILKQKVSFEYEIIVSDDSSTDNTVDIVKKYSERYSNIRLLTHEQNVGHNLNYLSVLDACNGEYIAHVDGDDFMLPGKLQKQADILDEMLDIAIVHHPVLYIDKFGNTLKESKRHHRTIEAINDLCRENKIINSSNMYRATAMDASFYKIPLNIVFHDWYFHLLKAQYGNIYFIDECLGGYRKYPSSVINKATRHHVLKAELFTLARASELNITNYKDVNIGYSIVYLRQVRYYLKIRQLLKAGYFLNKVRKHYPYSYKYARYCLKWRFLYFFKASFNLL